MHAGLSSRPHLVVSLLRCRSDVLFYHGRSLYSKVARDALRELLGGREPVVTALHAGLECGVIGDKAPGMDMVRFCELLQFHPCCVLFPARLRGSLTSV